MPRANRSDNLRYLAQLRAKARADGLCVSCLKRPVKPERTHCAECLDNPKHRERVREHSKEVRVELKELGICTRCRKEPVVPDRTQCESCAEYKRQWQEARRGRKTVFGVRVQ